MESVHKDLLEQFDEQSLPDLDVVTLGALELFAQTKLPDIDFGQWQRPLVIGSGNARAVGEVLFAACSAQFADESTYQEALRQGADIDAVILVSASGGKDATDIAANLKKEAIPVWLFTANPAAPATRHIDAARVTVFPHNREPYTYNTSTYMGMLLSKTGEETSGIHTHIVDVVAQNIPDNLSQYEAFTFILPSQFAVLRYMLRTKFDELFGARITGRIFTESELRHAKTVVPSEKECFVYFGDVAQDFGSEERRVHIPLPQESDVVGAMAVGYYTIGCIQKQHPPYFKEYIDAYTEQASTFFNQNIKQIVE